MTSSGYKHEYLDGPAPDRLKLMRRNLIRMGVDEKDLPEVLVDKVIAKTRKGPIGAIVVRDFTGLQPGTAHKLVKRFEENIADGHDDIVEKLEAVRDELKPEQIALLNSLRTPHKKSLARLMAEAHVEPVSIMNAYGRGAVMLGKLEAAIAAHQGLPALIRDLYRHALDGTEVCTVCVGSGKVPKRHGGVEQVDCPMCSGVGKSRVQSKIKEFAVQKLLEATKVVGKEGTTIQVNQQVAVGGNGGGGFFEKMLETSDKILFPKKVTPIIEAEVVQPEPSS